MPSKPVRNTPLPWNCSGQFIFNGDPETTLTSVARAARPEDARLIVEAVNAIREAGADNLNLPQRVLALERERLDLQDRIAELTEALEAAHQQLAAERSERERLAAHRDEVLALVRNFIDSNEDATFEPAVDTSSP